MYNINKRTSTLTQLLSAIEVAEGSLFNWGRCVGKKDWGAVFLRAQVLTRLFKGNVPPSILALRRRERALGTLHVTILGVKDGKIYDKVKFSKDFARKNTAFFWFPLAT